jgi:hypothetical protein
MNDQLCPSPLSFDALVDYWTGDLPASQQDAVEEHLFACEACTDRSEQLSALQQALRTMIPPIISAARLDRLVGAGARVRTTEVPAGGTVDVVFSRDLDLLIHRLRLDLPSATQVDCEVCDGAGGRLYLLERVPFDPARGEVLVACQRHYADLGADIRFRLTAADAAGGRHLRDYQVRHAFE